MATYLVTQATGKQSQWVIKHLLEAGAKIHAVVRNRDKIPEILTRPGITLFEGETVNADVIAAAIKGCKGVFLNTFPIPGLEEQQAKTVVDVARVAGVDMVVASTTFLTDHPEKWDDFTEECGLRTYYRSKTAVENAVRSGGLKAYTIVRPGVIHFDYVDPYALDYNWPGLRDTGIMWHYYDDDARMVQTDAMDIGKYAAAALLEPSKFKDVELDLATHNMTMAEVHDALVKVSGRKIELKRQPKDLAEKDKGVYRWQSWHIFSSSTDYSPVVDAAKTMEAKYGMQLNSLEQALTREREEMLESIPDF